MESQLSIYQSKNILDQRHPEWHLPPSSWRFSKVIVVLFISSDAGTTAGGDNESDCNISMWRPLPNCSLSCAKLSSEMIDCNPALDSGPENEWWEPEYNMHVNNEHAWRNVSRSWPPQCYASRSSIWLDFVRNDWKMQACIQRGRDPMFSQNSDLRLIYLTPTPRGTLSIMLISPLW